MSFHSLAVATGSECPRLSGRVKTPECLWVIAGAPASPMLFLGRKGVPRAHGSIEKNLSPLECSVVIFVQAWRAGVRTRI